MTQKGRTLMTDDTTTPRRWYWMPGALATYGTAYDPSRAWRCIHAEDLDGAAEFVSDEGDAYAVDAVDAPWELMLAEPVWNDPATLGVLTAQVRRHLHDPAAHAVPVPSERHGMGHTLPGAELAWEVRHRHGVAVARGDTEAAAWLAAWAVIEARARDVAPDPRVTEGER